MEKIASLHVEKLPEGVYLGTCDAIPGLVAQGQTIKETVAIAHDVAEKLREARIAALPERHAPVYEHLAVAEDSVDYPLVLEN